MAKLKKLKVSKSAFIEYLKSKRPPTMVGRAASTIDCPLAKFMTSTNGRLVMTNWMFAFGAERPGDPHFELPAWAVNFIKEMDGRFDQGARVTAKHALDCLK